MDAAGVVIKKKLLWIIGGTNKFNWSDTNYPLWLTYYFLSHMHQVAWPLSTSEIFNSERKEIQSGPILPVTISHHCVVELGQDEFLIMGGHQDGDSSAWDGR